ncbi:hypothetical protein SAY87_015036 [Trapa incisa]|uniref:NAC domain-containing protein n=1 Tax=Trapa incisa TaxID=236973 RepID=A0AAN7JLM6_9MYRT|nr:hypothetical protein SAY87_015035 [Trapa incisa]KAK4748450.1 hypothetical protein SAY87_015036 [Trapa incisa]
MMNMNIPGLRFHPTARERNRYIKNKLLQIDDRGICVAPEVNVYNYHPRDLLVIYNEKSCIKSINSEGFFLCPGGETDVNYGTSKKTCNKRKAGGGYWKETSKKRAVKDENNGEIIGTKKFFVYYEGNQKNSRETDFAMHEYHLNETDVDERITCPVMSCCPFFYCFPICNSLFSFFLYMEMTYRFCHVTKKQRKKVGGGENQQSSQSDTTFNGVNLGDGSSVTPFLMCEGTKTLGSKLEECSLSLEGSWTTNQWDIALLEQLLLMAEQPQPGFLNQGFNGEQDGADKIGPDLIQSYRQNDIGACSELSALGAWEDAGNPVYNCDHYEDGIFEGDLCGSLD